MKNWILIIGLGILASSCTKIDVNEELPTWNGLTPTQIETSLPVINIKAVPAEINQMMEFFNYPYLVSSQVTYYNEEKELLFDELATIEIKGAGSASSNMKPIGVRFSQPLDNRSLNIISPQFLNDGDDLSVIQNIRLRNSGQDYGYTMIKDLAYSEFALQAGLNVTIKYGKPVHVFINDNYYGMHNLRTENDRMALGQLLHVDTSLISIIKMDPKNENLEQREGYDPLSEEFIEAIKNRNYEVIRANLDIDNFIDYIVFEDYIGNTDWPHNNALAYRIDGKKFKFVIFDLDLVAVRPKNPVLPEMEFNDDHISIIYQILREYHPNFDSMVRSRQAYWYQKFSPNAFNAVVDKLAKNIEKEIPYLISRRSMPQSTVMWRINLDQLKRDFERTDHYNRKKYDL